MRTHRSLREPLLLVLLTLATLVGSSAPAVQAASPRVPQGFFGTVLGDPLFPSAAETPQLGTTLDSMVSIGVEGTRAVFDWSAAQPYASWSQVPAAQRARFSSDGVDAVPTAFGPLDALVGQAATRHLPVLPVIVGAPRWDGETHRGQVIAIPHRNAPYAAFCRALARRYGRHGSFWRTHSPVRPVTAWQVWNEPNVRAFWEPQPFAARYVGLLRAARAAIRSADPRAAIVLAGLANYSWTSLRSIYAIRGARGLFDVVGLHPYTRTPQGVVTILQRGRAVMRAAGDGAKPMIADEISWPSSQGKTSHDTGYDFSTTERGQARDVAAALPLLAANRRSLGLIAVYYYTWATVEHRNGLAFDFAGLVRDQGGTLVRKPVFYAYRHAALSLERCAGKGAVADVCTQRG